MTSLSLAPVLCPESLSYETITFRGKFRASILLKLTSHTWCRKQNTLSIKAQTPDLFGGGGSGSDNSSRCSPGIDTTEEEKEEPQCPPGLRQYETMTILRPDISEDKRLDLTQKYEELLAVHGSVNIEVFNRGVIPLAYGIKKKHISGECNTYLDGIYLLFTYFAKPEAIGVLVATLEADDDVIRSSTFKIKKRKDLSKKKKKKKEGRGDVS